MKRTCLVLMAASLLVVTACDKKKTDAPKANANTAKKKVDPKPDAKKDVAKKDDAKKDAVKKDAKPAATKDATTVAVGKPAADFTLKDETGKEHKLSAYKGKIVVLEWTNPECPYVVRHYDKKADTMSKTQKASGDDVVWLAVDSSNFVKADAAAKWKKEKGFAYPVLLDANGATGRTYGAKTTPHMFVIDKEGKLAYSGAIDDNPRGDKKEAKNYVLSAVKSLKEGKKVEVSETKPYGCSVKYKS